MYGKDHERKRSDFGCKTVGIEELFQINNLLKKVGINRTFKCPSTIKKGKSRDEILEKGVKRQGLSV